MKVGNIYKIRSFSSFLICVNLTFTVRLVDGEDGFISFFGHVLERPPDSTTLLKTRPCECKISCYLDPNCAMVSVSKSTKIGYYECLLRKEMDTSLLREEKDGVAWVMNRNYECPSPYNLVNGVGCIHIPNSAAIYSQAKDLCPTNSELYSPATMTIFENLRQHINKLKNAGEMTHGKLYLGLQRNDFGAFVWRTGGFIPGNDPNNPTVISPGTYPFSGPDPNDPNEKCAAMSINIDYLFYDVSCSDACNPICQLY